MGRASLLLNGVFRQLADDIVVVSWYTPFFARIQFVSNLPFYDYCCCTLHLCALESMVTNSQNAGFFSSV